MLTCGRATDVWKLRDGTECVVAVFRNRSVAAVRTGHCCQTTRFVVVDSIVADGDGLSCGGKSSAEGDDSAEELHGVGVSIVVI